MIINLRGTHGSGKSHAVRSIISRYPCEPAGLDKKGRPDNYKLLIPWASSPLYVVGSYERVCGGCDSIQPYAEIWPRVERFAALGHVLFEGALVSTNYGTIGQASEKYGDEFVFAFLNTPLALCLERIRKRRLARGNSKPLDPYQTTWKHGAILELAERFRVERGRCTVIVDYRAAVPQLLGMIPKKEQGVERSSNQKSAPS